jgi:hypothetical protein
MNLISVVFSAVFLVYMLIAGRELIAEHGVLSYLAAVLTFWILVVVLPFAIYSLIRMIPKGDNET